MVRYDCGIMIKGTEVNIIQGEIWKPIKGYEGLYFISNLSRVKRITPRGKFKERLLYSSTIDLYFIIFFANLIFILTPPPSLLQEYPQRTFFLP